MSESVKSPNRFRAIIALLLVVPAPSFGVMAGMVWWPGDWGTAAFLGTKVWMFLLPTIWWLCIEHGRMSRSPLRKGGLGLGALTGVVIAIFILGGYWPSMFQPHQGYEPDEEFLKTVPEEYHPVLTGSRGFQLDKIPVGGGP